MWSLDALAKLRRCGVAGIHSPAKRPATDAQQATVEGETAKSHGSASFAATREKATI